MALVCIECSHLDAQALVIIGEILRIAGGQTTMAEAKIDREDIANAMDLLLDGLQHCITDERVAERAMLLAEACYPPSTGVHRSDTKPTQ